MQKKKTTKAAFGAVLPSALRDNIPYLIFDVHRLHRSAMDHRTARFGLDRSQWWLLAFLIYFDGASQQQLATVMDMTRGGLTKVVDRLERKNMIRRAVDQADTRSKRVFLTRQGQALAAEISRELGEEQKRTNNMLTPDERKLLVGLLTRIRNEML